MERSLQSALVWAALDIGITRVPGPTPADTLMALIRQAASQGEVVILIDEYDHPILKALDNPTKLIKICDLRQ